MNIYDKTNKSIADVAARVMQQQPAKLPEPVPPLQSDMVQRVMANKVNTVFKKPTISEEVSKKKKEKECGCGEGCNCCEMKESNFEQLQSGYGAERPSISNAAATLIQAKKNTSKKLGVK